MITGKFHSHITISPASRDNAEEIARRVHGKITFIDLRGGRSQTDYMITHHFVTGYRGLESSADVAAQLTCYAGALREWGVDVLRVKLEHELLDIRTPCDCVTESIAACLYVEAHLKIAGVCDRAPDGWALSINAASKTAEYFLTRRVPGGESPIGEFINGTLRVIKSHKSAGVIEMKLEAALVDSNPALDDWWLPVSPAQTSASP